MALRWRSVCLLLSILHRWSEIEVVVCLFSCFLKFSWIIININTSSLYYFTSLTFVVVWFVSQYTYIKLCTLQPLVVLILSMITGPLDHQSDLLYQLMNWTHVYTQIICNVDVKFCGVQSLLNCLVQKDKENNIYLIT